MAEQTIRHHLMEVLDYWSTQSGVHVSTTDFWSHEKISQLTSTRSLPSMLHRQLTRTSFQKYTYVPLNTPSSPSHSLPTPRRFLSKRRIAFNLYIRSFSSTTNAYQRLLQHPRQLPSCIATHNLLPPIGSLPWTRDKRVNLS